MGLTLFNPKLL